MSASALTPLPTCYDHYVDGQTGLLRKYPFFYHYDCLAPYKEDTVIPIAAIELNVKKNTMSMVLNPTEFPRYDLPSAMFILAHEVLHMVYEHPMSQFRDHKWWPEAIDLAVNTRLIAMGMAMPNNPDYDPNADKNDPKQMRKWEKTVGLTPQNVAACITQMWAKSGNPKTIAPPRNELSAEEYLAWILDNLPPEAKGGGKPKPQPGQNGQKGQQPGQEQGDPDEEEDDGSPTPGEGNEPADGDDDSGDGNGSGEDQESDDGQGQAPADPVGDLVDALHDMVKHVFPNLSPEEREVAKQMVAEAAEAASGQASPPGNIAGAIEALIQSTKPEESWEKPLKRFTGMSGGLEIRTSMARRNKYRQVPKVVFRPTKRLLFAVDTSMSVAANKAWLARFLGIAEDCARFAEVDLMYVDYEVHEVVAMAQAKAGGGFEAKGFGGTDMRKIWYWIKANKKKYDGIIVATDLETPFPTREEMMGIKTLWVSVKNHPVPDHVGEVIIVSAKQLAAA